MEKVLLKAFWTRMGSLGDWDYLYNLILFHCAPVIQEKKPSTILTFNKTGRNLYKAWEIYKDRISSSLQLKSFELSCTDSSQFILFYSDAVLRQAVSHPQNNAFLRRNGYEGLSSLEGYLSVLASRYENGCPNEAGIFLGIPLEDVVSFATCSGSSCLLSGYWKVYHHPEQAMVLFQEYDSIRLKAILPLLS